MTAEKDVDFSMVDKFPKSARTRSNPSSRGTKSRSSQKRVPIPAGKRASRLQTEVMLLSSTSLSVTRATFYSYDCPSDECEWNTTWSLNPDAAYKTLETHIQWEHGREKDN